MIVRCTNCSSAFAVSDDKVDNKKFAFTCPKCASENIIDNRVKTGGVLAGVTSAAAPSAVQGRPAAPPDDGFVDDDNFFNDEAGQGKSGARDEALVHDDDFDFETDGGADAETSSKSDDSLPDFGDDIMDEKKPDVADDFDLAIADDLIADEESSGKKSDDINDEFNLDEIDGIDDKPAAKKSSDDDMLLDDIDSFDDEPSVKSSGREDKEILDEIAGLDETADFDDAPPKKKSPAPEDFMLDDIDTFDSGPSAKKNISDDMLLDEIDDFEEKPAAKKSADDDMLLDDIDGLDDISFDEKPSDKKQIDEDIIGDDISFDDIDSAPKSKPVVDELDAPVVTESEFADLESMADEDSETAKEKDIEDDFIPLEDEIHEEEIFAKEKNIPAADDESITIDLDSLDIDLSDEPADVKADETSDDMMFDEPSAAQAPKDDDITLDLDSLDIDLEEDTQVKKGETPDDEFSVDELSGDELKQQTGTFDEDITLNLDELDITLDETNEIMKGESPEDMEDEKLTLEDAGLTFDEIAAASAPESDSPDDDEDLKLTIEDIDPSLNVENIHEELDNEDIKLSIDDIDPSLNVHNLDQKLGDMDDILANAEVTDEPLLAEQAEDLPEIDIDEYFESDTKIRKTGSQIIDDGIMFDDSIIEPDLDDVSPAAAGAGVVLAAGAVAGGAAAMHHAHSARRKRDVSLEDELYDIDEKGPEYTKTMHLPHFVPKGSLNFSIDYSLKYSRLMAVVKLLGLIFIGLIPHFIVFMLYSALSSILGFLNQLIIITAGRTIEDFSSIQENTLRYLLSINALLMGVVDEMPVYAGRPDIDHPLQLNVTYPFRNSRLLAALRFSGIGIFFITLPHIMILSLISIALPLVYLASLLSIIVTARCPHLLFDFAGRYLRYAARVSAFMMGLIDEYPTFRFD